MAGEPLVDGIRSLREESTQMQKTHSACFLQYREEKREDEKKK